MIEFLGIVLPVARLAVVAIVVVLGGALALLSLYLLLLTMASFFPARKPTREVQPMKRFAIMIPAHNEELLIGSLLASLRDLAYPVDLYEVHVVADNCSDATAGIVRGAGAQVHERHDLAAPGKANAINWLAARILAAPGTPPDAFVMLDADSIVSPNFLREMNAGLCSGNLLVQGFNDVSNPDESWTASLRYIAFCLICYLRPLGRAALGLSVGLRGNGMCLSRSIIEHYHWDPTSPAEDHEFHMRLLADGIKVGFAPAAHVYSQMPNSLRAARSQNVRWERGKLDVMWRYSPRLFLMGLRGRNWSQIDGAMELMVPPFSLAFGLAFAVLAAGLMLWSPLAIGLGLFVIGAQAAYTLRGLAIMPRRSPRVYLALLFAPWFILWKLGVYVAVALGAGKGKWVRTARS
jgi:1,2-diacylglycerol 3-beta-glucosyltransferase